MTSLNRIITTISIILIPLSVVLFFIYYYNDTISSEDYFKNSFEGKIPLLAVVPDSIRGISRKKGYHRYSYYDYYETKDKKDNK